MHPRTPGMQIQALAVAETREALRTVRQWSCRPVLMAGDLPSASRHQLGWDNAVIRIIRTNHHSELMNHQPPPEHHGASNKEFLIPRNVADNKHSWKSVALPVSRVQLIKRKATFPFYRFGLSGQFGHLSNWFFENKILEVRQCDSMKALQMQLLQLNYTNVLFLKRSKERKLYYGVNFSSFWILDHRKDSDILAYTTLCCVAIFHIPGSSGYKALRTQIIK